jgi:uncharacterized protein (TIGR02996 family)
VTPRPIPDPSATLVRAIEERPDDVAAQLVLADWLVSEGDPRGELILLDHCERRGELRDPDGLERLLLLAAEHTFPRARPEPANPVELVGGGSFPVQYEGTYRGHGYYIRYRHSSLSAEIDDGAIATGVEYPDGYPQDLNLQKDSEWTDDETELLLATFRDAIYAGSPLGELWFPTENPAPPIYAGGARRCYRLPSAFTEPRGISRDRYGLAARDYARWHELWQRLQAMPR